MSVYALQMPAATGHRNHPKDYLLFLIAWLGLAIAAAAVRFLPFRCTCQWMNWENRAVARFASPVEIVLAVRRAAARTPWRSVCIQQGMVAHRMLRRAGHQSQFVYGISNSATVLEAHVWVRLNGLTLIGVEAMGDFQEVMALPGETVARHGVGQVGSSG